MGFLNRVFVVSFRGGGVESQQFTCGVVREGVIAEIFRRFSAKFLQTFRRISTPFPDAIKRIFFCKFPRIFLGKGWGGLGFLHFKNPF